jgi:hypothetical protein
MTNYRGFSHLNRIMPDGKISGMASNLTLNNPGTIHIDGIGTVLLERSQRARRVVISIRAEKGVRVAVPTRVSLEKALEFVHLKKRWIQKHLDKIEQAKNHSQSLNNRALAIDRVEAAKKLAARLTFLARKHRFSCNRVSIRNQRTRWGSCSFKNNISLNVKLVLLSEELIDYVMLHELVHTRVHNHSEKFWNELNRYVADARVVAKRLRSVECLVSGSDNLANNASEAAIIG